MSVQQFSKIAMSMLLSVAVTGSCHAASIETFSYPDGPLAGANGGTGWGGAWTNQFSRNAGAWSVQSGAAFSSGDGSRHLRALDQTYSSGLLFLDFEMDAESLDDDPFHAVELISTAGDINSRVFSIGVLRGDDGTVGSSTDFYLRSENGTNFGLVDSAAIAPINFDTNRFVVRFDLDNDTADAFLNPTASTNLLTDAGDASISLLSGATISGVGLANFGDQPPEQDPVMVDNLSLSTEPAQIPEPATVVLMGICGCALLGLRK